MPSVRRLPLAQKKNKHQYSTQYICELLLACCHLGQIRLVCDGQISKEKVFDKA